MGIPTGVSHAAPKIMKKDITSVPTGIFTCISKTKIKKKTHHQHFNCDFHMQLYAFGLGSSPFPMTPCKSWPFPRGFLFFSPNSLHFTSLKGHRVLQFFSSHACGINDIAINSATKFASVLVFSLTFLKIQPSICFFPFNCTIF